MLIRGIFLLLLAVVVCIDGDMTRYDNYRFYSINLKSKEHVKLFQNIEQHSSNYIFLNHVRGVGQQLKVMVAAPNIDEISNILKINNVDYTIGTDSIQDKINEQLKNLPPQNATADQFNWNNYFYLNTIYAWLDQLAIKYEGIVSVIEVGKSYYGVPLKGVKVSYKANNTAVFVEGGIHAREWISPATATFILNQLLTSMDPKVQDIAQHWDWFFFPVFNPDGYKTTFEKNRLWRKTRRPFGECIGTDLNRNWDADWNGIGSSQDPCSAIYAGPEVFSEPESYHLSQFLQSIRNSSRLETYIALHSYSQLLLFPSGSSNERVPNYDDLLSIGQKAVIALKQRYGTNYVSGNTYDTIYPSAGGSDDWAYFSLKIPIVYTFELRGPSNSSDMFILPANQIIPTGYETLDAFVTILTEAKKLGYYNVSANETDQPSGADNTSVSVVVSLLAAMAYLMV